MGFNCDMLKESMTKIQTPPGVELRGAVIGQHAQVLTPEALDFFAALHREFNPRRLELLQQRKVRQVAIDRGELPSFLPETKHVREGRTGELPVLEDTLIRVLVALFTGQVTAVALGLDA